MKNPVSIVGANVIFCGHAGYFVADVLKLEGVAVVHASAPVTPAGLFRHEELGRATHRVVDFPVAGFWKPRAGVFVVPIAQFTEVPDGPKKS
jgi:hypothetical protein